MQGIASISDYLIIIRNHKIAKHIFSIPGFCIVIRTLLLPQQDFLTSAQSMNENNFCQFAHNFTDSISIHALMASDELAKDTLYLLQTMLPTIRSKFLNLVQPVIKTVSEWTWEDDYHNFTPYDETSAAILEER